MDDLRTIRDFLRYGVTEFTRAKLVFGHGTSTALDEAAFLILVALDLPHDELAPWLDCRLTLAERTRIHELITARVETRLPAPYLLNTAFIQGHRFYVDERVIVPRSFIGELMAGRFEGLIDDPDAVASVLDLCTGSGCLAILAALAFPLAKVDASDISRDALDVARRNVRDYGLADRVRLLEGDLFEALSGAEDGGVRYGLIIANPPYVAKAEVAAFDPEYQAEPPIAHLGGEDGLDLVQRIVADAARYLETDGLLVVEIGTGRATFEASYPELDVVWLDTETSQGEVFAISAAALRSAATANEPGGNARVRKPRSRA